MYELCSGQVIHIFWFNVTVTDTACKSFQLKLYILLNDLIRYETFVEMDVIKTGKVRNAVYRVMLRNNLLLLIANYIYTVYLTLKM